MIERRAEAEFEQFQRDIAFGETHHDELLKRYPEQWVAILNEGVVGAAPDVYHLLDELTVRRIPTERVVLRHLSRQEELLIL